MSVISNTAKRLTKEAKDKKPDTSTASKASVLLLKEIEKEIESVAALGSTSYVKVIDDVPQNILNGLSNILIPALTSAGLNATMIVEDHPFVSNKKIYKLKLDWSN